MKKQLKKILLGTMLVLVSGGLFAQRNMLRYADIEYDLKRFEHTGSQYAEAFNIKQTYYAAKRAAESYTFIKSYQKAFEWWGKTVKFAESDREDYLNYARAAAQAGQSLTDLGNTLTESERSKVYGGVSVAEDKTIVFRPLEKYNSAGTDYGLRSDREDRNYFVSDRNLNEETQKKPIRLDVRKRFSGDDRYRMNDRGFHQILMEGEEGIVQVSTELEGVYHLSSPAFYENGDVQQAIFTAVLRDDKGRKTRRHEVHPGLYTATVEADGSFGKVKALPFNKLSEYGVMHGVVYNDRLYFSSDMPGGFGGFDLYVVELIGETYGPPVNLGQKVNEEGDEVFPYLYEGDLYFSSNRMQSIGGLDIYKIDESLSGSVENMGRPYNSSQDDFAYYVDAAGLEYLSSDRGKSESRDDIYSIAYLSDLYRLKVNAESGERLDSMEGLELKVIGDNGIEIPTNIEEGRIANLKEGDYMVEIRKKGYFPAKILLSALAPEGNEKLINYTLIPIPYGKSLAIDTIYYDLDKYNIRPDAAEILERSASILKIFQDFNMDITSHTDSRASNLYNERLSENRSRSATLYLKDNGVQEERLNQRWLGNQEPIIPCLAGIDCSEEMHAQNRRSILRIDFFPKEGEEYQFPAGFEDVQSNAELLERLEAMVKQEYEQLLPIILAEDIIYYDLDSYEIRADAEEILKTAETLLNKFPFLKLKISSHTDSRQSSLYNDKLSKNRSMSAFFNLKNKGISSERMIIRWFSKENLKVPCLENSDCSPDQHQLNRRSVLTLSVDRSDLNKVPKGLLTGKMSFSALLSK